MRRQASGSSAVPSLVSRDRNASGSSVVSSSASVMRRQASGSSSVPSLVSRDRNASGSSVVSSSASVMKRQASGSSSAFTDRSDSKPQRKPASKFISSTDLSDDASSIEDEMRLSKHRKQNTEKVQSGSSTSHSTKHSSPKARTKPKKTKHLEKERSKQQGRTKDSNDGTSIANAPPTPHLTDNDKSQFFECVRFDLELFVYNKCVEIDPQNNWTEEKTFSSREVEFKLQRFGDSMGTVRFNIIGTSAYNHSCMLDSLIQSISSHYRCLQEGQGGKREVVQSFKDLLVKFPLAIPEESRRSLRKNDFLLNELLLQLACLCKIYIILFSVARTQGQLLHQTFGYGAMNGGKVCYYQEVVDNEPALILIPRHVIFMYFKRDHYESVQLFDHFVITPEVYKGLENERKLTFNKILRLASVNSEYSGNTCVAYTTNLQEEWHNLQVLR